jgi:hypothetical protein
MIKAPVAELGDDLLTGPGAVRGCRGRYKHHGRRGPGRTRRPNAEAGDAVNETGSTAAAA